MSKCPEVDEALNQWFIAVSARGVSLSGPTPMRKAEELAAKLQVDFKATDGWLSRWKQRHCISYKKAHSEKGSADTVGAEKWKAEVLPQLLQSFEAEDVYNADQTALFYCATPDGSLCCNHITLSGSKKSMDRLPKHVRDGQTEDFGNW
jgi:hypothetical protein